MGDEISLAEMLDEVDFRNYLERNGLSENTQKEYANKIKQFLKYMDKFKNDNLNEDDFLQKIFEFINMKKRTWGIRFAILSYLRYKEHGNLAVKFNEKYRGKFKMKSRKLERKSISFGKMKELCSILPMPHKLITMIQYDTACRINDVLNIKLRNIEADADGMVKIKIKEQKTDNLRTIYISSDTAYLLAKYIEHIKKTIGLKIDEKIFKISYILHSYHIKQAGKKIGEEKITSHWIRTSRAIHLLNKGYDIITIKNLLNHSSIKTTEIYLREAGLDSRKLIEEEPVKW